MESVFNYVSSPSVCGYLPDRCWQLEYVMVSELTSDEYMERLEAGWRRFGISLFRPRCQGCAECRSLRVCADRFRPDRSQRRVRAANEGTIRLEIGTPRVSRERLDLYDRYHAFQSDFKGWPEHDPKDARSYSFSFVENPIVTQEWCYYLDDRLVGVGYVDDLPRGLSAIYFFHDPDERHRSLGTWNVLCLLEQAARKPVPHLYLGYFVAGCRSMQYKARYKPNEIRTPAGYWQPFCT
ncbi:MAG: arginyltransferase [Gemmataceae bacterium]